MKKYMDVLEGNLSVGLGGGNPAQWRAVAEIAKEVKANHFNQAFCAVGWTRANLGTDEIHLNSMCAPCGKVGYVKISTGPLSRECAEPAIVPVDTAIAMIKEMGGNSIKYFPMGGLKCKDEMKAVAEACARNHFIMEPTGGIQKYQIIAVVSGVANGVCRDGNGIALPFLVNREAQLTAHNL